MEQNQTIQMFDKIAENYDSMNHIISFGLDKLWRKKFVKKLKSKNYDTIADIATGTGDLLVELLNLNANKYYALDPSTEMLEIARTKLKSAEFVNSSAENLAFDDNFIDLFTISFGIRNFSDIKKSIDEMQRALKTNGLVAIMEFSIPNFFLFRWGFYAYLRFIIPILVAIFSKNKSAYKYLCKSIIDFGKNTNIQDLFENKNFETISIKKLALGAVSIYLFKKIEV
ncbi:bifunctional demethylmenaquinone methyltransferase/2-methoxy-6-polyprenyl-1,4-benzoquinol methylase UbiE [Bacteroidales bacterium OttesenSCG-928-I21]|nr:bifunctional demethylmenaquinone methyltransferase/2-methoxy-6-polyprenyl-1,4-benzoquinol methylase UbiE [Bacteroidales bacterium OttesenSCG-928-I21]